MKVTKEQVVAMIEDIAKTMAENKEYLTELDSAIGDGDHGINMNRGFQKVLEKLPSFADKDIGTIFKNTGMALISAVGGASGPLYGTLFMQFGKVAANQDELDAQLLGDMLVAGLEGIKLRGKASVGEKTMVDALEPAVTAFQSGDGNLHQSMVNAVAAAEKGQQSTQDMVATKGRAHYLGERSRGHLDPGATSTVLLLRTMLQVLER